MHKKDVLIVGQLPFNVMGERHYANRGSDVCDVTEHLSGKQNTTVSPDAGTGSVCGLQRAALSNYFANYPGTVRLNSIASKITGLNKPRGSKLITLRSGMWFMTLPISTRMAV